MDTQSYRLAASKPVSPQPSVHLVCQTLGSRCFFGSGIHPGSPQPLFPWNHDWLTKFTEIPFQVFLGAMPWISEVYLVCSTEGSLGVYVS